MPPNREYWWSTKQPQVTDLRWQLGFQWHRRGIELVFKSLDCFTKRLFHTFFCCYICICCLKLHQADYKVEEFVFCFLFFNLDLVGERSAPMHLLFAPYTDLYAAEGISAFQTSFLFHVMVLLLRYHAIIWTNPFGLWIGQLPTNFSGIWIKIQYCTFHIRKCRLWNERHLV